MGVPAPLWSDRLDSLFDGICENIITDGGARRRRIIAALADHHRLISDHQ
jgi:hypothetical protein